MFTQGILLETNFRGIGLAVAFVVLVAFVILIILNTRKAQEEIGSEIELAANRKEYYKDEDLEGKRLDRSLAFSLVMLCFIAVAFGFYMVAEPGRQAGAVEAKQKTFESRGKDNYVEGAQCVNCHAADGSGGGAAYILQDADGQYIADANWNAPALNNVLLRYSEDEVRYILNYGRTGSPMAAWGTPGGGPLTTQAVQNTIEYIKTLQIQSIDRVDIAAAGNENPDNDQDDFNDEESQLALEESGKVSEKIINEVNRSLEAGEFTSKGQAVFNLGLYSGFNAGSLSCARCHTSGWSLGAEVSPNVLTEGVEGCGGGTSGIGFNLCGNSLKNRFPDDTWKKADGSWMPEAGLTDDDGNSYIEAADGSPVMLNDKRQPVNSNGELYLILSAGLESTTQSTSEGLQDLDSEENDAVGSAGDLASCSFVSDLYPASDGIAYPIDPNVEAVVNEDGSIAEPEPLDISALTGVSYKLETGRVVSDCELIEMPERTSVAQYKFVFDGANAGKGYGVGGVSSAGMMPGFGKILPEEYIQEVVDYVRSLE